MMDEFGKLRLCGGAKGIEPRPDQAKHRLPPCSLRLVPIQSRSLPAVLFSGLDGVKRGPSNRAIWTRLASSTRLLHHATAVITDGQSYRMKDAQHRLGAPLTNQ
jgi:hypothetical protein